MLIDAHHHLWRFDPRQYDWISANDRVLRRDFLVPEWEALCAAHGIERTIVVQARQTLDETRWLLELAARSQRIAGVVGWVPLADPLLPELLVPLMADRRLKAVRHVVQGESDPDFLLHPMIAAGLRALAPHGLAYDLLVRHHQLNQATACVDAHPELRFVLDHAAKPPSVTDHLSIWARDLRTLAQRPNVWCKLSGLATELIGSHDPTALARSIAVVLEAFGPQRVLFGSDWPVCLLATGYGCWLNTVREHLAPLTSTERAAIFGGNAVIAYRL